MGLGNRGIGLVGLSLSSSSDMTKVLKVTLCRAREQGCQSSGSFHV